MKSKFQIIFMMLLTVLFINKCTLSNKYLDKELRIRVDQGDLFVQIKGNPDKPLLVNLHGGPGGSSAFEILLLDPYLREDYLVVYLDQRGCGKSSLCTDTTLLTIDQYVKDLDVVIDTLLTRFNRQKVNLLGTSWGGTYGFHYLLMDQSKVNAFTAVGATINQKYKYDFLLNHELEIVRELVESKIPAKQKEELLRVLAELERIEGLDISEYPMEDYLLTQIFPPKLGYHAFYADPGKQLPVAEIIRDETQMSKTGYTLEEFYNAITKGEAVKEAIQKSPEYYAMNLEEELAKITIPVMVIQGAEDYTIGKKQAQKIYENLVNVDNKYKELQLLPNVGHSPAIETPETLKMLLNDFFGKFNDPAK